MRIFLRRDITWMRCFAQTHASRKPNVHAGLQQHTMLHACRSRARAHRARELGIVMHVGARAVRCVSKKNDAWMRQRAHFFTRSHAIDAFGACVSMCRACLSTSLTRLSCASCARAMRETKTRCDHDDQRCTCTCRKSRAARQMRDRREDDACVSVDCVETFGAQIDA